MKLVEELMDALVRYQEAKTEVERLVAEVKTRVDGRRQKRKPRKKRAVKTE